MTTNTEPAVVTAENTGTPPGPWKTLWLNGQLYINPDRSTGEFAIIAKVHGRGAKRERNGRVLALAPCLLQSCRDIVAYLDAWTDSDLPDGCAIRERMRAQIARADEVTL